MKIKDLIQNESQKSEWKGCIGWAQFRSHLYIQDHLLMYKERLVIPKVLRRKVLDILHSAHQGQTNMYLRTASSVWWPNLNKDLQTIRQACKLCDEHAPSQPKEIPVESQEPVYPFQYIVADFCQVKGKEFLVIVDRYTSWPVVYKFGKCTSVEVVKVFRKVFETYGVCEKLTTDGGTPFIRHEFQFQVLTLIWVTF